ncbi:hypothetical protein M5689_014598 [Euphorbia peplus]|nr:hypothetical protein M5689_014598 [Euphorbia peplus]
MSFLLHFMASSATTSHLLAKFLLVFLGLLFILPLLARSVSFPDKSMAKHNSPQLKHAPTFSSSSSSSSSGAVSGVESAGKQFKAAAHEVPSGPNPESN